MLAAIDRHRSPLDGESLSPPIGVLSVALLGPPQFRFDGRELRLAIPRNALRVMAYLLLNEGLHARERVATALWPDDDESGGRTNLRRHLHLVQRALPATPRPWLECDAAMVGWNPGAPVALDVTAFERGCTSPAQIESAIALYRADLLADWDDEWLVPVRDRVRAAYERALETLVQRARDAGDADRGVAALERVRVADPWREDALRALVTLRAQRGDRAGALAEYAAFAERLRNELDVEPMAETRALYESVRDRETPAAVASAGAAERPCVPDELPFVGRCAEKSSLRAAWHNAASGHGTTVLLAGEPGVGKTRMLDELARDVAADGGHVLRGRCGSPESEPLEAFTDALRPALALARGIALSPAWLGVLSTVMPQLRAEIGSLPDPPALSPPQQRTQLYEAVWCFIAALARSRPLLLALDDVHSAGASTVALLEFVARRARRARVLVAVAWREREYASNYALADLRRRLDREGLASVVPFGALNVADVCELLRPLVIDDDEARDAVARELHRRCNGNALLIGETLRAWADAGVLDASARRWRDTATIPQVAASAGHTSILRARIERLTDDARTVAEIAAIAGDTFSAELVREASGIGERRTLDALDVLIDERIVRDGVRGQYAFNHDVVRAAIADEMPESARRRRHRRIAQVLERLYPERIVDLAQTLAGHYDLGDEPGAASVHYARASSHAAAVFANQEALTYATRALELGDDPEVRIAMLRLCEELYGRRGERDAQRSTAIRLASLARRLDDADMLIDALRRRIEIERVCGDSDAECDAACELDAAYRAARRPKSVRAAAAGSDAAATPDR